MCMFGGGGSYSVPAPPEISVEQPPAVAMPIEADVSTQSAALEARRRRLAATGRSDTVLTGGSGLTSTASTGGKYLLGQ